MRMPVFLMPKGESDRQRDLSAAIEPIAPAVRRLSETDVRARLAAAVPPDKDLVLLGGHDAEVGAALYPVRLRGLLAAEHAGAAHLIDNCVPPGALWGWEVDDPTWDSALNALDVAMRVAVLDRSGLPVTPGMRATHRLVLEIAGDPPRATAS